jgi:hypothetical protein
MNYFRYHWEMFTTEGDWLFGGIAWAIVLSTIYFKTFS